MLKALLALTPFLWFYLLQDYEGQSVADHLVLISLGLATLVYQFKGVRQTFSGPQFYGIAVVYALAVFAFLINFLGFFLAGT